MSDIDLKKELERKSIHICLSLVVVFYYMFGKPATLILLLAALLVSLSLEYLRIRKGIYIVHTFRKHEKNRLAAHIYSLSGSIIAVCLYSMPVASAAILMAAFGDAAGAIFGKAFGKTKIPMTRGKTIEGSLSELAVDFAFAMLLINDIYVAVIMSVSATFFEVFVNRINDNLSIPVMSGFAGEIAVRVLS